MSFEQADRYDEEDMLQWCLDPESKPAEAEGILESDPDLRAVFAEFEGAVTELRVRLSREETEQVGVQASALAEEILDSSTREDLTWRGDLRLVRDYVGRRVSGSWVLKLVAASLVIHLSALPILGFMLLVEHSKPGYTLWIEKPIELPFEDIQPEPDREVDLPDAPELQDLLDAADEASENED